VLDASQWRATGTPGSDLVLYLLRKPAKSWRMLRVQYGARFGMLARNGTTDLDPIYLHAAARALWYGMMGDRSGVEAERAAFLQLMAHWQNVADGRLALLGREVTAISGQPTAVTGQPAGSRQRAG
jgi:hypothetical protein